MPIGERVNSNLKKPNSSIAESNKKHCNKKQFSITGSICSTSSFEMHEFTKPFERSDAGKLVKPSFVTFHQKLIGT